MSAEVKPKVIAYYANPVTKKVEKHEMWRIDFDEARKSGEGKFWSLVEPKAGVEVEDKVPVPPNKTPQPDAAGPPVLER